MNTLCTEHKVKEGPEKKALKYSTSFANFYRGKHVFLCFSHFFEKMTNIIFFLKKRIFFFFKGNVCALPLPPVVRSIHWAVKRAGNGEEKEKRNNSRPPPWP